jgi:hypothetical protein
MFVLFVTVWPKQSRKTRGGWKEAGASEVKGVLVGQASDAVDAEAPSAGVASGAGTAAIA